ncbi:DUF2796 domain-containing protein [Pseudomonas sp. JS3066]|jgi:hypothetical protein|uniref:DUF2796 domain-containing protein n=1 Tax=unclassified Pseudomonas TaxID=196821 RepID=UPI000EAA726B|nr:MULTISPECIES: DUF2796 domain-containing protein [unclassified Pseudomonas]AYF88688.1 DUF2796 domain-containing protein [Pseudomonas sp. DY-1]MDH4651594.1 DUF2796 domain-containing protein [Pseudomonas sp. BN606]MRK20648.1 DUF2796 domain-containing protein [Pseudomonas sp. JG-B]WVK93773.1 DUF2796 domain-containing protein [Pseudomonas sp. JS3066]
MRSLLLALPFALLPLAVVQGHEHDHDHEHGSLGAHEHGVAQLNAVLDGKTLELELESPAMNLVGFEHEAKSDADKAKVAAARAELEKPLTLFALPATAGCKVKSQELESPLFGADEHHDEHAEGHDHEHSEVHAHYQFECAKPDELKALDLAGLFKRFPATLKIQVQLIGPNGQQGAELSASNASLSF